MLCAALASGGRHVVRYDLRDSGGVDHRSAVGEFAAAGAELLGDDPAAARATAERIWDRTPGTDVAVAILTL